MSYVVGSIPFGYLIGLSRGIDIRNSGSGNIGATNVYRTLGRKLGIITFLLDFSKGIAATCVIPWSIWYSFGFNTPVHIYTILLCGILVLTGHSFPVFLNFKGGKGVASGLGVAVGVAPWSALIGLVVWIVFFLITRYVSIGSITAACVVAVSVWFLDNSAEPRYIAPATITLLAVLIVLKHRKNIVRLINGNENRFDFSRSRKSSQE